MKRKLLSLLLTLTAVVALSVPALADVIWEPTNSFYESHSGQCDYENRAYLLGGYEGEVALRSSPQNGYIVKQVENGKRGVVQFIWHGGEMDWGYLYGIEGEETEGWAPMDDLSLIYDSQQFMEDHAQELVEGAAAEVTFSQAVLYDYPGGPTAYVLEESKEYQPFSEIFTTLYTDENGLRWGYVGYYMGHRERWACLDDPMNEHLGTAVVETAPSAAQLRGSATVTGGFSWQVMLLAAVLLVAAVVAGTVVLIRRFCPKKNEKL